MHERLSEDFAREERRRHLALRAMQLIHERLAGELSVEGLARALGVSCSTLSHVFPGVTGETVWQHVRRIRLERAALFLLTGPGVNVLDVAISCGFESQSAFTRAFKRAFGCSPTTFRRRRGNHLVIEVASNIHDRCFEKRGERGTVEVVKFRGIDWLPHRLDVRVNHRPAVRLAVIRDVGESDFDFITGVLRQTLEAARRQGLLSAEARFYGISYEDPYLASRGQISYEVGITIPPGHWPASPFHVVELPAGQWACVDCSGPHSQHVASWHRFFFQWLPDSRWTLSQPLAAQQFHLPSGLLHRPAQLIRVMEAGFSTTELIPVRPGPRGLILPV